VAAWAYRSDEGNGGRVAAWAERPSRPAGHWAEWPEVKENSFPNKKLIFDYSKALKICRRRFRRNFEVGIFPKFF
jgi:hypothetical protein